MNKIIKETARVILYYLKRKSYKIKIYENTEFKSINRNNCKEFFYGYYDRCPERNGILLFHEMDEGFVKVIIRYLETGEEVIIGESKAYNWQMGCRALWIDDDIVAYNDFDGEKYVCRFYSINRKSIIKTFDKPIQDYSEKGYFLGINYQRLRPYGFDYAYYCLPEMTDKDFCDYQNDGIWKVDIATGEVKLILSIQQVLDFKKEERFSQGKHFLNHVMINPNGDSFIFIHRYFVGKERYDRLMYYGNNELKCLMPDKHQSHYCWLNPETVFGYGEYIGKRGFHYININDGEVKECATLTEIHPKDGHPTVHGDWIVVDCYPNLSRMQVLSAYNVKTRQYLDLLEVFHDLKHKAFDRCDLHPRLSADGKRLYYDTIYTGKRMLCCADISRIIV